VNIDTFLAQLAADNMDEAEHTQALADYDALCHEVDTDPREQQRVHDIAALIDADAALYTDGLTALENDEPATARILLQRAADLGIGDAADILREISGTVSDDPPADPAEQASSNTLPAPVTDAVGSCMMLHDPATQAPDVVMRPLGILELKRAQARDVSTSWLQRHWRRRVDLIFSDPAALDTSGYLLDYSAAPRVLFLACGLPTPRRTYETLVAAIARTDAFVCRGHGDPFVFGVMSNPEWGHQCDAGSAPLLTSSAAIQRQALATVARDIMTPAAEIASIQKTLTVDAALRIVLREDGAGTPVLDGDNLVGVITPADVGRALHSSPTGELAAGPVGNYMREPAFVTVDTPVDVVQQVIVQGGSGLAVVLTTSGEVAGYVAASALPDVQNSLSGPASRPTLTSCC
jgi:CBS domain-containing protein